ncbi:28S ribosomal protein S9, mitochondrial-like [Strongylocentrotus purpuratus]|uniref:Small ribosomal subunit protein uS9m n=1 Tax=Strongylocentrotus purpuratus TaxID=7668 RepID=A0A7M7PJC4_STRPU|nr:28S ribosomal protein S9, mitochondrial-like [Strongylocentrotus purpuratus]
MAAHGGRLFRVFGGKLLRISHHSRALQVIDTQQWKFFSTDVQSKKEKKQKDSVAAVIAAAQDRRTAYDTLIQREELSYERGRRHLANMMGEDPEDFKQEDVDRAIEYLFPSGLFDKKARPMMKPPADYYPPQKAAQFGPDGRPFDALFYTGKPNYYNLMHDTVNEANKVIAKEDEMIRKGILIHETHPVNLARSEWIDKASVERIVVEALSDKEYLNFISLLERILQLPYASEVSDYIHKFRRELVAELSKEVISPILEDENGQPYSKGDAWRKSAKAWVTLKDQGKGQVTVNGMEFLKYFTWVRVREQILFPFNFTETLGRFDVECEVVEGGRTSQAGAVRLAISRALCSFVDQQKIEQMRQAGLLTLDPRLRERKKPGQAGARKKFTWKKR